MKKKSSQLQFAFLIFLFSFPASIFSQTQSFSQPQIELMQRFRQNKANVQDAQQLLSFLESKNNTELAIGLTFAGNCALAFPKVKSKIEEVLLRILNNPNSSRRWQAAESALSVPFSEDSAMKLEFLDGEDEMNLIKAILRENSSPILDNQIPEFIVKTNPTILNKRNQHYEAYQASEWIQQCALIREIARILFVKRYYKLSYRLFKIIFENKDQFSGHCVADAKEFLSKFEVENPERYPDSFDGKDF